MSPSTKCGSRSRLTVRPCSTANGTNIATNYKKTQSPKGRCSQDPVAAHLEALWSGGGAVRRTLWSIVDSGPSPSLPSSTSQEIVLSVSMSAWLHYLLELPLFDTPFIACCVWPKPGTFEGATCKLVGSLSARYEKISGIDNISRMTGHAAQRHVLLECLRIYQLISTTRSSIPVHRLESTVGPSTLSKAAPQEITRASFPHITSLQDPPPTPTATTLERKG